VVADELVQLDQLPAAPLEPGGEALVQLRAGGLGHSVVGGVPDQQVAEAEAVLARQLRPIRANELLAHECGQPRRHLALAGAEGLDTAAVEDLSLDGAALEHPPLGRLKLVEPGRKQRPQRRRDRQSAVGLLGHDQDLRDEQRVAARGMGDPLAQLRRHARSDQLVDLVVRKRLEPQGHRPRCAALGKLRPRHAEKEKRRAGGEQPHVLDEVEEGLLPPLDVVENDNERCLLLEQLAEGPGDLLRRRAGRGLAE
jgi:hypothetical protein